MMSEAGIKIDWQYKFNERTPDLKDRIKKNGEYIALGEMIKKDQLALKELEKTSNESSPQFRRNFNNLKILSYGIDKLINSGNHAKSVPEVGDIVYHRKLPKLGYRTIVSIERNKVTLNSIGSDSQNSFLKDHLEIYSYEALMQYTNTDAN